MTQETVIDIAQLAISTLISVVTPVLLVALVVGIAVSIFQTVTSIQEQTMAFIPKILSVFISILFFGPYIITTISDFIVELFNLIQTIL